jgi:mRNA-degrading endonuclease RelE of RelBE toxin-antitoxin system
LSNDRLRIAPRVGSDWKALPTVARESARRGLESLDENPIGGSPLFQPLRGYWSWLRDGIRIIYRLEGEGRFVMVLKIEAAGAEERR